MHFFRIRIDTETATGYNLSRGGSYARDNNRLLRFAARYALLPLAGFVISYFAAFPILLDDLILKGLFISLSLLRLYTNNAYIATSNYIQMQYMVHITTAQNKVMLHKCLKTQQNKESLCNYCM